MKHFFVALLALVGCVSALQAEEEKYLLRYQWKKGDVFAWEVTHRNRTTTMVGNLVENIDTYAHSEKSWEVESVDEDGVGTIINVVPWAEMREKKEDGTIISFDSRVEAVPEEGFETAPASLGRPLARISIDARGKQVAREDYQTTTIVQQANQAYVCVVFPEEAIPVGYSWTTQYPVYVPTQAGLLQRVDMLQRFTLEEVADGIARVAYSTKILTPLSDNSIRAQIIDRLYSGVFLFDVARGRSLMLTQKVDEQVFGFRGEVSRLKIAINFDERLILK
ncbi:MAG: hypothetical protein Q4D38_04545 [Planctomycetia bacterium]|nr:hypothetical protein [Planctomycetia bacterium]